MKLQMFKKFANCQLSNNLATEKFPFRTNQDRDTVCGMFDVRKDCLRCYEPEIYLLSLTNNIGSIVNKILTIFYINLQLKQRLYLVKV